MHLKIQSQNPVLFHYTHGFNNYAKRLLYGDPTCGHSLENLKPWTVKNAFKYFRRTFKRL